MFTYNGTSLCVHACACVCMCVHMRACAHECRCLEKPEEGSRFPGCKVTGICEMRNVSGSKLTTKQSF